MDTIFKDSLRSYRQAQPLPGGEAAGCAKKAIQVQHNRNVCATYGGKSQQVQHDNMKQHSDNIG